MKTTTATKSATANSRGTKSGFKKCGGDPGQDKLIDGSFLAAKKGGAKAGKGKRSDTDGPVVEGAESLDHSVDMYLSEIGAVELLSKEQEVILGVCRT